MKKCRYIVDLRVNIMLDFASLSSRRAWIEMLLDILITLKKHLSLSSRRAWIEINLFAQSVFMNKSLSSRRAWIEIAIKIYKGTVELASLSSRRAWIEMQKKSFVAARRRRRSPHGERGLK